ncbi:class II aldolase/adducin family protein [uncultured Sneathiella sp.]|jgi:ribulose-5-phosphate 4-epimerase/fuculose-1-phosphate aldolase|uniref:class II aldolase/adducin family protein n=1 Tax=uncultured Sneathiella sp. TaxID=879315 RepID=UPI0030DAA2B8|tara:strand:+ start:8924 stop:9694 length:771 start_codon:yes stop_codon:yes gene_type:complete
MSLTTLKEPSSHEQYSETEWQVRVDLAAAYRLVALYGWDDLIFTHISARLPGEDNHFLINPYGMMFEEITASSLVKVDMNGEIVGESEYKVNPAGFTIHSAVHEVRHDAACVIHLHTAAGTAVATQEEGLMPLNQTALVIREQLAYHEYEGIALNHEERPRLQKDLGGKKLMLLWNHGTLALGETVADAFLGMYFLERACEMQVASLAGGEKLHYPSDAVMQVTAGQGENGLTAVSGMAWKALLRKLDRQLPGYAD